MSIKGNNFDDPKSESALLDSGVIISLKKNKKHYDTSDIDLSDEKIIVPKKNIKKLIVKVEKIEEKIKKLNVKKYKIENEIEEKILSLMEKDINDKKDTENNTQKEIITKEQIIAFFKKNIKEKEYTQNNENHDGDEGHWIETLINFKPNSNNAPYIGGYEMKKNSKKILFGRRGIKIPYPIIT
jgi:hypothetical protein